jgi:WD40 repeat protein
VKHPLSPSLADAQTQISRRTLLIRAGGAVWISSILLSCGASPSTTSTAVPPDQNLLFTYKGHFAEVYIVAWAPDSKRLASAGNDQTVQVWDARNGSDPYTYKGHSDRITALDWSHHGDRIVSGSRDGTAQVWNTQTGKLLYTYTGHAAEVLTATW